MGGHRISPQIPFDLLVSQAPGLDFEPGSGGRVKKAEEVMEILEAYDLAGTLRGAAVLAGCDHKTVAHWVRMREQAGGMPVAH